MTNNNVSYFLLFLCLFLATISVGQTITNVLPNSAWQGQSLNVTISGTNLNLGTSTSTISWLKQGSEVINSQTTAIEANQIVSQFDIPAGALIGAYDVLIGQNGNPSVQLNGGFNILSGLPVPDAPVLQLPTNGATLNAALVNHQWSSVANATSYQLQTAPSSAFMPGQSATTTVTSNTASLPYLNDHYFWRVRAGNQADVYGAWSNTFQFDVVASAQLTSITPSSAVQGQQLSVTISGVNVNFQQSTSTAIGFNLSLNSTVIPIAATGSNQFNGNVFELTANGAVNVPLGAPIGTYDLNFWDGQNQTLVLPLSFVIGSQEPTPNTPLLIAPIGGVSLSSNSVTFDWTDATNAAGYQLQVSTSTSFNNALVNITTPIVSNHDLSLYTGNYYWRVRARNSSNIYGPWSTTGEFELDGVTQVTALNPNNGYAGQQGMNVSLSGVNLPFNQSTSTIGYNAWLNQNGFQIDCSNVLVTTVNGGSMNLNIPLNAPVGYYNFYYEPPQFGPYVLNNAFYVTDGNQYTGQTFIDVNQNNINDGGDLPYPNAVISTDPTTNYAFSQANGAYSGYLPSGTFDINIGALAYFTSTPSSHTVSFVGSGNLDTGNDFALHPIPGMHDMTISVSAQTLRQNRNGYVYLTVKNMGTEIESGQFSLTFPAGMTLTSSSDPNYTLTGNTITWNFTNFGLLEVHQITVVLFAPMSFQVGQVVNFTAEVTDVAIDQTPNDNTFLLENQVVNSYDPNFKEVSPASSIPYEFVQNEDYLNYTVHFQNTGNAEALDVYILDTISNHLALETFQVVSSSHSMVVNMLNDHILEFRFDDINLPDSTTNEPQSHGYVSYRIKPTSDFQVGDVIRNTGHIYFDFNPAIVTNTVENWILTGIDELNPASWVSVSPNPGQGFFLVACKGGGAFTVRNIQGQEIVTGVLEEVGKLDISKNPPGVYILTVWNDVRSTSQKIVLY